MKLKFRLSKLKAMGFTVTLKYKIKGFIFINHFLPVEQRLEPEFSVTQKHISTYFIYLFFFTSIQNINEAHPDVSTSVQLLMRLPAVRSH